MRNLAILTRGNAKSRFWVIEPDSNWKGWDEVLDGVPIRGRSVMIFGTLEEAQQYVKDNR